MNLYCDNQSVVYIASNSIFHGRMKHMEVDCYFIRDAILLHKNSSHVSSEEQLAGIFTKALGSLKSSNHCDKLYLYDIHTPALGGVLQPTDQ